MATVASDRLIASDTLCDGRTHQVFRMHASRTEKENQKTGSYIT